jgi:hypothetical protein
VGAISTIVGAYLGFKVGNSGKEDTEKGKDDALAELPSLRGS